MSTVTKSHGLSRTWGTIKEKMLEADRFPAQIQMNFNKKTEIPTCYGFITTMLLYCILGVFAMQRAQMLIFHEDPVINVEVIYNAFEPSDEVHLGDIGFQIAFGVMEYDYRVPLYSKDHVEWNVYLEVRKDLLVTRRERLDIHICNETDYERFFEVTTRSVNFFEELKE